MAGQKDISAQVYENRLKGNPRSLVFSRLADSYRKRGDIQSAVDVCTLGLKNHPRSITGRVILGRCYLEQEKFKEAIQEFARVIESDPRNQVALKMLADVYARQGLKEKAGDVYAYLRVMDPENPSIVNLCANFTGTGRTNIFEILGLAVSGRSSISKSSDNQDIQQDILEDIDKTISLRVVTDETLPQDSGPFAQTMQFDAEELKAAPSGREFQTEEVVGDIDQTVEGPVTGDDISSRMSMMFEEEGKTGDGGDVEEVSAVTMEGVGGDKEVTEHIPLAIEAPGGPDLLMEPATEISGGDISSRIEQLFGEKSQDETLAAAPEYVQTFNSSPENIMHPDATDAPAQQHSGAVETLPDAAGEERAVVQDGPGETDVSGEDVVNRMSQLFEAPAFATEQFESPLSREPASPEEENFDKTVRFDAVIEPMREIGIDENKNEDISEVSEAINSSIEEIDQSDTMTVDTTVDSASSDTDKGATPAEEDAISGDDVAARLETIFDEQPLEGTLSGGLLDTDVNIISADISDEMPQVRDHGSFDTDGSHPGPLTVAIDENLRQPEDESFVADEAVDKSDTSAVADAEHAIEETRGAEEENEIPPEGQPPVAEEPYGDIVTGEESPEMSGDDIVNRLTEIFPDNLLQEDTLSIIESIPEDEKENEEVHAGFYTVSGENAQTAQSEDTLLEKLDDVEIEVPASSGAEGAEASAQEFSEGLRQDIQDENKTLPQMLDGGDRPYSIPDHVLTPTLADIYFQQGQPNLAVQIYSRLLERDPDNEKISRRLEEIKKSIVDGSAPVPPEEVPISPAPKKVPQPDLKPSRRPRTNKAQHGRKPLEGVRIKKEIRNRRK
jgi:Tetratricopeptide repeat